MRSVCGWRGDLRTRTDRRDHGSPSQIGNHRSISPPSSCPSAPPPLSIVPPRPSHVPRPGYSSHYALPSLQRLDNSPTAARPLPPDPRLPPSPRAQSSSNPRPLDSSPSQQHSYVDGRKTRKERAGNKRPRLVPESHSLSDTLLSASCLLSSSFPAYETRLSFLLSSPGTSSFIHLSLPASSSLCSCHVSSPPPFSSTPSIHPAHVQTPKLKSLRYTASIR